MPPRHKAAVRAWGTTYVGTGDLEVARGAVERALFDAGLRCRTIRIDARSVVLEGEQEAAWYRVLARGLPQKVRWSIARSGEELRLASDFHVYSWYSAVLFLLWVAIAACFAFDYLNAKKRWLAGPTGALAAAGLLVLAIVLMPVVIHLLNALGGRSSERLWHGVVAEIEKQGGHLSPFGNTSLRYSLHLLAFFGFALALTVWFVSYSTGATTLPFPDGAAAFLGVLGGLIALLLVILALMFGRRGFNLRTYPILTGLMTMLSALFLLQSILLPWWLTSEVDYGAMGTALRPFGVLLLAGSLLLVAAAAYTFLYFAVYSSVAIRPQLERLRAHGKQGAYWLAVGGASPLPFQTVFLLSWLLMTGLILASLGALVACALQSVLPFSEHRELQLVQRSTQALAAVLGLAPGNPTLMAVVRSVWIASALVAVSLLLASIGQLGLRRRASRRRFAAAAKRPFAQRAELEAWLAEIRCTGRLPPIRLALDWAGHGEPLPNAGSERFGILRTERYVEISAEFLDLPAPQLEAVLDHECAHHYLGHLTVRSLALWLGRLSFTGDGFVYALLDSFGWELQADRAAVRSLGASREGLAAFLESRRKESPIAGPPMTSIDLSRAARWRHAVSLFLSQYRGDQGLPYWHPDWQERIVALREGEEPADAGR